MSGKKLSMFLKVFRWLGIPVVQQVYVSEDWSGPERKVEAIVSTCSIFGFEWVVWKRPSYEAQSEPI